MKTVTSLNERRDLIAWQLNPTIRFLSESLRRPLSIRVNSDNIAKLALVSKDAASDIASEISLWRKALGDREIANLELRYRENALPTYDITRLIHGIASEFKLVSCECRVLLHHDHVDKSALALLKGLGFSHCQFEISDTRTPNLQNLANAVNAAREFKFKKIGVQIVHSDQVEALTQGIRLLKKIVTPDYVFIGTTTYKLPSINDDCGFTLFEDDIADDNLDHLDLGPSATSDIQGRAFDTLSDARRYTSALANKQLPLIEAGFPETHSPC